MTALSRMFTLAAVLAASLALSSCYTQLGSAESVRSDHARTSARAASAQAGAEAPTWTGQTAQLGLRYEVEEPVYEEGYEVEYYEGETYAEGERGYDDVQVTRYRYDEDYYDSYDYYGSSYGGYVDPYYVAYAPYYYSPRWRWYYLYSPYYPAPSWAYGYDPFFDLHYRHGWGWGLSISFGSPYYYRPYYSPYHY